MNNSLEVRPVTALRHQLGEGLHWDSARLCLWGVDIIGCKVWSLNLDDFSTRVWKVGQPVGWILPLADCSTSVLLGLKNGIALACAHTMTFDRWLNKIFTDLSPMRMNDAKADVTGAIWCGSLNNDDEREANGCLYRSSPEGGWTTWDTGYTIANGPAIDATQKIMMHTDSGRRTIYMFDLDVHKGILSQKRVWKVFSDNEGVPDGMCFDAEGTLWVAHWGASCVSRFALDGSLLLRVSMPTTNISNVCFGGAELDRLFVTSAKVGLTSRELISDSLAGCVFEVLGHGATGLPSMPATVAQRHLWNRLN